METRDCRYMNMDVLEIIFVQFSHVCVSHVPFLQTWRLDEKCYLTVINCYTEQQVTINLNIIRLHVLPVKVQVNYRYGALFVLGPIYIALKAILVTRRDNKLFQYGGPVWRYLLGLAVLYLWQVSGPREITCQQLASIFLFNSIFVCK